MAVYSFGEIFGRSVVAGRGDTVSISVVEKGHALIQIGVIGTDNTHAYQYCAFLNGWSEDVPMPARTAQGDPVPAMHMWALALRQLERGSAALEELRSMARVTRLWSADGGDAELLARACGVELCPSPSAASRGVDAILVLSERPEDHEDHAAHGLRAGLPTYIDKPMAPSSDGAARLFADASRHGATCLTGSSLRYSRELVSLASQARQLEGGLRGVHAQIPVSMRLYGIHALEALDVLMGHDIDSVSATSLGGRTVAVLQFRDDRTAVIDVVGTVNRPCHNFVINGREQDLTGMIQHPGMIPFDFLVSLIPQLGGVDPVVTWEQHLELFAVNDAVQMAIESGTAQRVRMPNPT